MANLYNKAGLINIPVGYSDGFLYNIKPTDNTLGFKFDRASAATRVNEKGLIEQVGYFGPELVQNGDFDTNSDWHLRFVVIEDGVAKFQENNSSYSRVRQNTGFIGQAKVTYTISFNNTSITTIQLRSHGGAWFGNVPATVGTHTVYNNFTDAAVSFQTGVLAAGEEIHLDNVSVTEVLGDKPRIDYTDSLTSPSFLLEPQSTNLLPYSEGYSQWSWGGNSNPNNTTRVDNQSSPDGGLNASLFTRNSGTSGWFSPQNITVSLNNTFTYSIFVKKNNSSTIELNNVSNSPQNKVVYNIDLNTFTTETNATGNSVNYGNGWYRISMTFEHTNSGGTSAQIRHTLEEGKSMFVFGSQAEQKSFVTSYIPTFGSASTRAAETCVGAGNASTFNSTEGVLYAEFSDISNNVDTLRFINIADVSNVFHNRISLGFRQDNRILFEIKNNNNTEMVYFDNTTNVLQFNKMCIKYKNNDCSVFINGVKVHEDNSATIPSNLNTLIMAGFTNGNYAFQGNLKSVIAFKEALTDDELQQLTGPDYNSFAALAAAYNYTVI